MGQNTVATFTTTHLQELLITVQVITIEKVPFSDIQHPKTVCYQIDC